MSSTMSRREYRPDIDGLRAIAVTSVVLFHAGLGWIGGGYVGVDVFFVISGYLIAGHIYQEVGAGRFSFVNFYARRSKRILPALIVVLAASLLIGLLVLSPRELSRFGLSAVASISGISNIYFWASTDYFAPAADHLPLLMTWSLGVEEQFYLFFPIVLIFLFKWLRPHVFPALAIITLVSLACAVAAIRIYPSFTFYMLPPRAWELGVGATLAIAEADGRRFSRLPRAAMPAVALLGLVLLAAPIFLYNANTMFPGESALAPALGAALLIAVGASPVNSLLASRPFTFVGRISYSWYLWHWPLLAFCRIASPEPLDRPQALAIVALSFLAAIASYYLVEQPFRQTRHAAKASLLHYGVAVAACMLILAAPVVFKGFRVRMPAAVNSMEAANADREKCIVQYGASRPDRSEACLPKSGRQAIALIGDSHAAALAPGLRTVAKEQGYDLFVFTKSSCPPMSTVTRFMPNHPGHDRQCAAFNSSVMDILARHQEIRTVVMTGYWSAPLIEAAEGSRYALIGAPAPVDPEDNKTVLKNGLAAQVEKLRALGKKVIVLQDVPIFDVDPVAVVLRQEIPARNLLANALGADDTDALSAMNASRRFARQIEAAQVVVSSAISSNDSVALVDPKHFLCGKTGCEFVSDRQVLYIDNQHLSPAGAKIVARSLFAGSANLALK
jgi:peptidoglycan/LPS O-acetylase OafA/YrhL